MTTRRLRFASALLAPWCLTASLLAAPLGQPTPPPCTADGCCVPARETWGYYEGKWRRWPGTELEPTAREETRPLDGPRIPPVDKPDPNFEDRAAPEKIEALEPQPEGTERESDIELPEFPGPDGERPEGDNGREPPPRPRPPRPGFMEDAPVELPFGDPTPREAPAELPFGQPPAGPVEAPTPADDLFPHHQRLQPQRLGPQDEDAPPPLPFVKKSRTAPQRPAPRQQIAPPLPVQHASLTAPATTQRPTVRPASYQSDAPPRLPVLFQRRGAR